MLVDEMLDTAPAQPVLAGPGGRALVVETRPFEGVGVDSREP